MRIVNGGKKIRTTYKVLFYSLEVFKIRHKKRADGRTTTSVKSASPTPTSVQPLEPTSIFCTSIANVRKSTLIVGRSTLNEDYLKNYNGGSTSRQPPGLVRFTSNQRQPVNPKLNIICLQ